MMTNARWTCEWCGKTRRLSVFAALFKWFLPRYCPIEGECAGWPAPSCRYSVRLAERVANRKARKVHEETLKELHGQNLGKLRGHPLAEPSNNPRNMRKALDFKNLDHTFPSINTDPDWRYER